MPAWVRRRTSKWNRVVEFGMHSCDAPWPTYITAAFAPAGKAIITLLSFGLDDVARGYLRPKGLYKNGCLGRKKRGRNVVGVPEVGEEIGKRLPGADLSKSRSYSAGEKHLWLLDGVAQRILFWVMVGDIVTDFAFDYVQGIYRRGFCQTKFTGQYVATNWGLMHGYPPIGDWQLFQTGEIPVDQGAVGTWPLQQGIANGLQGSTFCEWTLKTEAGENFIGEVRLVIEFYKIINGDRVLISETIKSEDVVLLGAAEQTVSLSYSGGLSKVSTYVQATALEDRVHAVCNVFQLASN